MKMELTIIVNDKEMELHEVNLIGYCYKTCCLDCDKTDRCLNFYNKFNKLPYTFYKVLILNDITYKDFRKGMKINE